MQQEPALEGKAPEPGEAAVEQPIEDAIPAAMPRLCPEDLDEPERYHRRLAAWLAKQR